MDEIFEPRLGMRFTIHGANFEVSFCAGSTVRYSNSAGGKVHQIPYTEFIELQRQKVLHPSPAAGISFVAHNAQVILRKHKYVEAALRVLDFPTAKGPLSDLIRETAVALSDANPPAVRTVAYWIHAFQKDGMAGLAPKPNLGNRTLRINVELEQIIAQAIREQFLKPERRRAPAVFGEVIAESTKLGVSCKSINVKTNKECGPVSLRTIQRRIEQLDPYVVTYAQKGNLAASKMARAAGRSIKSVALLALVQMDTHVLDVLVVDPDTGEVIGRPGLTIVLDVNTRCIVGTYFSLYPASATTALAALKKMLSQFGVPAVIVPDNGVEFANSAFTSVCEALAITISPAQVRDPNGKAHIESFFRTFTLALVQTLQGTTFSNPKSRGDYDSVKEARFTLQQVESFAEEWITEVYHKTVHTRTMRAPIIAWEEQAKAVPPIKLTVEEVDALARRPYQRTISCGRVQYNGLLYFSHAFATLEAQGHSRVTVLVDELDLRRPPGFSSTWL